MRLSESLRSELQFGNDLFCFSRDFEFFVCRKNKSSYRCAGSGDIRLFALYGFFVEFRVNFDTEKFKVGRDPSAGLGSVFTDRREYDSVATAHGGDVSRHYLFALIAKHIKRKFCVLVTYVRGGVDVAEVRRNTADGFESALLVHQRVHFRGRKMFFVHYISNGGSVFP